MPEERTAGRLFRALVGDPTGYEPPPPPENIPPLPEMLRDLVVLGDRAYAAYAFSRDPLRGKFTEGMMDRWTEEANRCGRVTAQGLRRRYGTGDVRQLAGAMGLAVEYPEQPAGTDHVTFAQFSPPNRVSIFRHSLEKAEAVLADAAVTEVMGNLRVSEVLLAHELFHYAEEQEKKSIYTRTEKIELWAPWPLHNRSTVRSLSEIAGMAFARELTGLAYSAFVLDVFLIYGYTPAAAFLLYEEIMEYKAAYPG